MQTRAVYKPSLHFETLIVSFFHFISSPVRKNIRLEIKSLNYGLHSTLQKTGADSTFQYVFIQVFSLILS